MNRTLLTLSIPSLAALTTATVAYSLLNRPTDTITTTASPVTVERIRELGLRAGIIEMPQHATITVAKPAEVLSFKVGESSLSYSAAGVVEAAINLSALNEGDIVHDGVAPSAIVVTLPAPTLTGASIDVNSSYVVDRKQAFVFAPDDKHFQDEAAVQARSRFIDTACASGILKRSAENAKASVLALAHQLGVANVRVEVREPKECRLQEQDHV